jgi:hypothetical protein
MLVADTLFSLFLAILAKSACAKIGVESVRTNDVLLQRPGTLGHINPSSSQASSGSSRLLRSGA